MRHIGTKAKCLIIAIALIAFTIVAGFIGKLWYDIAWEAKNDRDTFHSYLTYDYASDDTIIVRLTQEETRKFLDYTPKDFADIGASAVSVWNTDLDEYVIKKVNGIPVDEELNIDIEEYQRSLEITLDKKSKKNVIKAIKTLSIRDGIESAHPAYLIYAQSISSHDDYYDNKITLARIADISLTCRCCILPL